MSVPYIEPIPEGWEMRLDDATQTYYFIDHNKQKTQWQHPINNLVYRPTETISRANINGCTSTPITINRHPVSSSNVQNYNSRFYPSSFPEQKSTIPVPKHAEGPKTISPEPETPKQNDVDLELIAKVIEKAKPLLEEVDAFDGTMGDKNYLRLVESLDILILELDGIGVDGLDSVRAARRAAVKQLQQAIEMLEFRASTKAETNALSDSGSNSVEQAATSPSIKDDV